MRFFKNNKKIKIIVICILVIVAIIFSVGFKLQSDVNNNMKEIVLSPVLKPDQKEMKLYYFYLPDSPTCNEIDPVYEEIKKEYEDKIEFEKLDVEEYSDEGTRYVVNLVPTMIIVNKEGNVINRKAGVMTKDEFVNLMEESISIEESKN